MRRPELAQLGPRLGLVSLLQPPQPLQQLQLPQLGAAVFGAKKTCRPWLQAATAPAATAAAGAADRKSVV